ncbi:MAG: hypothetical protein EXS64_08060 [Candidatus Latescibacteria bacterium]|nr:hypothetical protein [Candidatus Latescibacterota bacterium]
METVSEQLIEHLKRIEPAKTVDYSLGRLLKNRAEGKLAAFQERVKYCQTRYHMSADEFYAQKIKDKSHTWAEEETYFDWVSAIQGAEEMEKEIAALEEILAHADG